MSSGEDRVGCDRDFPGCDDFVPEAALEGFWMSVSFAGWRKRMARFRGGLGFWSVVSGSSKTAADMPALCRQEVGLQSMLIGCTLMRAEDSQQSRSSCLAV